MAEFFMSDAEEEEGENNDSDMGLIATIAIEYTKFGNHVSELFSPPRVTKIATKIGLHAGFALDLTQQDEGHRMGCQHQE